MYLCNEQITVFNRYTTTDKKKEYVPTIISNVHWFGTEQVTVTSDGLIGAKKYTIRIPIEADTNGKTYVSPKQYQLLSDRSKVFTLDEGDIIVKGVVDRPSENIKPNELQSKYDEVITVVAVTDSRNAPKGKHWKVVGK